MLKTSIILGSAAVAIAMPTCVDGTKADATLKCVGDFPIEMADVTECATDPCTTKDYTDGAAKPLCCEAFVATCGKTTAGGAVFACVSPRVYDATKADDKIPADGTCCKDADATCDAYTCTAGTKKTTPEAITGATDALCCDSAATAEVKGMCTGNTVASTNVVCTDGNDAAKTNTQNKGADTAGTDTATCCEAPTAEVKGMCTGNTDDTTDVDCSKEKANTQNKGKAVEGNTKATCCEAPKDSGAASVLPSFVLAAAGFLALYY